VEIPNALYLECPECEDETLHEVLKGRGSERAGGVRLSALVKCGECGTIRTVEIKEDAERSVNAVLSDEGRSTRCTVSLDPSSVVSVGDIIMIGGGDEAGSGEDDGEDGGRENDGDNDRLSTPDEGMPGLITAIEVKTRRVPRAKASTADTLWLRRYDKVKVKVSVNTGRKTISRELWAAPDEQFEIGDVISAGDMKVLVHSMNTGSRKLKRGSAAARKIRRIYGREVE